MASTKNPIHRLFGIHLPQWKEAAISSDSSAELQLIGAGLARSGTSSLKAALELLGLDPCHHMAECVRDPTRAEAFTRLLRRQAQAGSLQESIDTNGPELKALMRGYLAAVDGPAGEDFALELAALYPNAKILLSVRDSDAVWYASFQNTIGVMYGSSWRAFFYRVTMYPVGFLWKLQLLCDALGERWDRVYGGIAPEMHRAHNEMIRAGVPPERLLEYNVKEGWEPLCRFLDKPMPEVAFPRINDAKSLNRISVAVQVFGVVTGSLYAVGIGGAAYLACRPDVVRGLVSGVWGRVGSLL